MGVEVARIPFGTIITFIICLIGLIIEWVGISFISDKMYDYEHKVLDGTSAPASSVLTFNTIISILIAALIILILIVTVAGANDVDKDSCLGKMTGWIPFLALLIVTYLMMITFCWVHRLRMIYFFKNGNRKQVCKRYYNLPWYSRKCIEDYDVLTNEANEICDSKKVAYYCNVFVDGYADAMNYLVPSGDLIAVTLEIFVVILAVNYVKVRVESQAGEISGGLRRV